MPDQDKPATPHAYGAPDPDNQTPPAPEGMRGEGSASLSDETQNPVIEKTAQGRPIAIEDVSGVAYAEDSGHAGLTREKE